VFACPSGFFFVYFCFAPLFSVLVCPVFLLISPPLSVFFFLRLCLFFVPPGFPACDCISLCPVYWVFSVFFWISFAGFLPSVLLRFLLSFPASLSLCFALFFPLSSPFFFSLFWFRFSPIPPLVSVQFVPPFQSNSPLFQSNSPSVSWTISGFYSQRTKPFLQAINCDNCRCNGDASLDIRFSGLVNGRR